MDFFVICISVGLWWILVVKWMVEFHNLKKCMHTSVELEKWMKNLLTSFMFILYTDMLLYIWNFNHVEYVNFWIVIWKLQKNIQISCFYLFHHVLLSGLEISTRMLYDWRVHTFFIVFHNIFGISRYVSLWKRV